MGNNHRATHSAGCDFVGKDGIRRELSVTRFDDESIGLYLRTHWDGDSVEPLQSSIRRGAETYSVLLSAMNEMAMDRERFAIESAP